MIVDLTPAVDAGARALYEAQTKGEGPSWDQVPAVAKLAVREAVLPVVQAASTALTEGILNALAVKAASGTEVSWETVAWLDAQKAQG